ncbi:Long-chain-fatty-acid--CoA ligase 6 [Hypsibius exemplaris]|uniref:Long-chain-fatty-acid--CoA ligase n=1 Tax=Hypsibius exemplaris TaxID=2072580 RepID=A0A1W0XBL6_HYPEX|nr:Long-chain-fatty-acid--CoA ligase 6 [Hypsibius exemplaris]
MEDFIPALSVTAVAAIGTTAAVAYYCAKSRGVPIPTVVPIEEQSLPLGKDVNCRRSRLVEPGKFVEFLYEDTRTLYEVFQRGLRESSNGPCLGHRPPGSSTYHWISYEETIKRAEYLGAGLIHHGAKSENTTFIGIFSKNRPEWIITELACYTYSMVVVPIYDTLGAEACSHIISQAEISSVVCDRSEQAAILVELAPKTPVLRRIIIMEPATEQLRALCDQADIQLVQFAYMLKLGQEHPTLIRPAQVNDIATICYTSGTTGIPKGVVLTHRNVVAAVCATMIQIGEVGTRQTDSMVSFLPLSHMLTALYIQGGRVGFYSGDIKKLSEDMKALKPTCAVVVPRLLNRIYDGVTGKVKGSWLKESLLNVGVWFKERDLHSRIISRDTIWDRLMFKKVQDQMGGNIRFMVVGSAPLSPKVLQFCRVALGCCIMEGYGQTEAVAPVTLTINGDINPDDGDNSIGHVGAPIPCCLIKLVDVPELGLSAERDGTGEVCIKGASVFQGYYKDPVKTKEVLDEDGWLHTGDIGLWGENACLRIVDRKKHIFKLSQGEYIAPEKIESAYVKNSYVAQVFVHGESLKSSLVGIVIPAEEVIVRWAASQGIHGSFAELCKNPKVKAMLLKELLAEGKASQLHSFEQVKDIYVHPEMFSVENDMLTPTLKTKRNEIKKTFSKQLADLYSQID